MQPILQFDPANLAIWFVRVPAASGQTDVVTPIARDALLGDHERAIERVEAIGDEPTRIRAAGVLSSVWHEQRHFVDVLLTNYGQATMRHITSAAMNVPPLLRAAAASGRIGLPLAVYRDEVRRFIVGVDANPELCRQADDIRGREELLRRDHLTHEHGLSLGGRAQLEAIGFMTQVSAVQHELGPLATAIQDDVPDRERLRIHYQWAHFLGKALSLVPPGAQDGGTTVLAPAVVAFLYGTLMIRRWGQEQTFVPGGDSGSAAGRFDPLFVALRDSGALAAATSSEQAWAAVDAACADVFGRSASEELRHDLACEERFLADLRADVGREDDERYRYLSGVHEARLALAALFFADPTLFTDPGRYGELLGHVFPIPIFVELHGTELPEPGSPWETVWGYSLQRGPFGPQAWAWALAPTEAIRRSGAIHTAADAESWSFFVRDLIPIARLMLYGRRRDVVLGPELLHAQAVLAGQGLEVRFDPLYAAPTVDISSDAYWFLTSAERAVCDGCPTPLERHQGHLVPAVIFQQNHALSHWVIERRGPELGPYLALRDWSGWLLCDSCRDELKALGAAFHEPVGV